MEERMYHLLERIALAFEEQNRQHAAWIALQTKWRADDKKNNAGMQIVGIHERHAERESAWIDEQRKMLADHLDKQFRAYLEELA